MGISVAARSPSEARLDPSRTAGTPDAAPASKAAPAQGRESGPDLPAVIVELSDRAKSLAAGAAPKRVSPMEEKLGELKATLVGNLQGMMSKKGISPDASFQLSVDRYGGVTTDGIHKDKVEEFFRDDPEARKALKQIVDITAMIATQKALEAMVEEKKAARTGEERDDADTRFLQRSMTIQDLSRRVTFEGGAITTGAEDYVTVNTEAKTPEQIMAREAAAGRLKAWD